MKICFLTENIFSVGGVSRVVTVLANEMVKANDVTIIGIADNAFVNRDLYKLDDRIKVKFPEEIRDVKSNHLLRKIFRRINQKVIKIPAISFLEKIYLPIDLMKKYIKILEQDEYDVVIAVQGKLSLVLGKIAPYLKAKCIGWQHNSFDAYFNTPHEYYWNQFELFKKYIKQLDKYIVLTDDDEKELKKRGITNCLRIYNPNNLRVIKNNDINLEDKIYDLIFVGRLVKEQKGLDFMLDIIEKVYIKNNVLKVIIVGDGKDRSFLEDEIKARNLEKVITLVGQTNNVEKYYRQSKILISTSRWEGFGLVLIEAMSLGVPVVSFSTSGPSEILANGQGGILISKYDIDEFAKQICNLLFNMDLLNQLSKKAIFRTCDFNIESIVYEWYKQIVTKK